MSKLKINDSILNFLKKNKIKICALSFTSAMIITSCGITNFQDKSNIVKDKYKTLFNRIEYSLKNNSSNIEVKKNENGSYTITEYTYKEVPIFDTDENSQKIITGYKKEVTSWIEFYLSSKQAENLGLTNLLEEKTNNKVKTK